MPPGFFRSRFFQGRKATGTLLVPLSTSRIIACIVSNEPTLHVVLHQPEIPQNTGNIGRTCVALRAKLWLVRPLGFRVDAANLRRAGLDYWKDLDWEAVDSWAVLEQRLAPRSFWFFTKKASLSYCDVAYAAGDVLVFGSETQGLPESIVAENPGRAVSIPILGPVRSLNLACAAGIGMYEAHRQIANSEPT